MAIGTTSIFNVEIEADTFPKINEIPQAADALFEKMAFRVVQDIKRNIRLSMNYRTGGRFTPLAPRTIAEKRGLHRGSKRSKAKSKKTYSYPERPLWRTGLLSRSIVYKKLRKHEYRVYIRPVGKPTRDLIAEYQQNQGVNQYTRITRPFFGMSGRRQALLRKQINTYIRNVIKKAYLKKVKKVYSF